MPNLLAISCSKDDGVIYKPIEKSDPYVLYKEGLEAFEKNDIKQDKLKYKLKEEELKKIKLEHSIIIKKCKI